MAYNALEAMRRKNNQKEELRNCCSEVGPKVPELLRSDDGLKSAALAFIHNRCEDLRFDEKTAEREAAAGVYEGTSTKKGEIPYNMQMDIDRLTFERAIERFLDSGVTEDAFDVYFCYLEMFIGKYAQYRRMIELLSEFENNASSLLMKHRDHYSHSVYVFLLGLAIFETNKNYRSAYLKEYGLEDDNKAAHHFLEYWGLTSLFHDIGYPFELPFEQVCSYFEVDGKVRTHAPFIAYSGMASYVSLKENEAKIINALYDDANYDNLNRVFAHELCTKVGSTYHVTETELLNVLENKPARPDKFGHFMDHAYFSAVILARELISRFDENSLRREHMDAVTAILMHNSLYKYSITNIKDSSVNVPFKVNLHPLAYLLMLCDELQCWDRCSYGRNSRTELHPMKCSLTFKGNGIQANYIYDLSQKGKISEFEKNYQSYIDNPEKTPKPKLKAYSSMVNNNSFLEDIRDIVDLSDIPLAITVSLEEADYTSKKEYLSESNFLHLYDLAVAMNAQYNAAREDEAEMISSFEELSLEYKLSNILQAKTFKKHLDSLNYFYTDRPVSYRMVTEFSEEELEFLSIREHLRWESEKRDMCWLPSGECEIIRTDKALREQTRMHYDLDIAYHDLERVEQLKDTKPLNEMVKKLEEFEGLRIYSFK